MDWGNVFLAIGFFMYGSYFTNDEFWQALNNMTATVLNIVIIVSIVMGTVLKAKEKWKQIKSIFTKKKKDEQE